MKSDRVFLPQDAVDSWLTARRIEIEGDVMTIVKDRQQFVLKSAVYFVEELTGAGKEAALLGKVKDFNQLSELGAEHCADSVIHGEHAYRVVEGFTGEVLQNKSASPPKLADARKNSVPELDLLARYFLSKS